MITADMHKRIWTQISSPFLFPPNFEGHTCEWELFACTQAGCILCGAEHRCPDPNCILVQDDDGHVTCTITGAVVREQHHCDEWTAPERAFVEPVVRSTRGQGHTSVNHICKRALPCETWDFVNGVVVEILKSRTTDMCRHQEFRRLCSMQISHMHKEIKKNRERGWVNMLHLSADIMWNSRKIRRPVKLEEKQLDQIVDMSTDAITKVLLKYNNVHITKVLNNDVRKREFICSMLYLMRTGVDCRGECILPKIHIMSLILPLETFLPDNFKVRAKSITEGENLLKIELRHMFNLQ